MRPVEELAGLHYLERFGYKFVLLMHTARKTPVIYISIKSSLMSSGSSCWERGVEN